MTTVEERIAILNAALGELTLAQITTIFNTVTGANVKKAGSNIAAARERLKKALASGTVEAGTQMLALVADAVEQNKAKPTKAKPEAAPAAKPAKQPKAKKAKAKRATKKGEAVAEETKEPEVANVVALVEQAEATGTVEGLKRLIGALAKAQGVKLPPNFLTGHIHKNHRGPVPLYADEQKFVFTGAEEEIREGSKISQRIANTKKLENDEGEISVAASVKGKYSMHRADIIWAERKGLIEFVD